MVIAMNAADYCMDCKKLLHACICVDKLAALTDAGKKEAERIMNNWTPEQRKEFVDSIKLSILHK